MSVIPELIQSFIDHLCILNRSTGTIRNYRSHLHEFLAFLNAYSIRDIHDITAERLLGYQRYRHYYENRFGRHDSVAVQNRHIITIKTFFAWLKDQGFLAHDPAQILQYAKEPRRLPKSVLTNTEVKKLLAQPDTKTLTGYRDRTILEVLYSTGIRRAELLGLNCGDIDYGDGYLRVNQGKGKRDRITPLGKIACRFLETYIKGIRPLFLRTKDQQALFLSKKGRRLSTARLDMIIAKYARLSGIQKHITTHTFRRSCATGMIKNKANLMHIKELLGHKSMQTIQVYCNLSIVDLKEAHKKCHPREKDGD